MTKRNHNIDFPVPISGLSIIVSYLGSFGVDVTVLISGSPDQLKLKVGLNAFLRVHHMNIWYSKLPCLSSEFHILKGKYSFGDICNSTVSMSYPNQYLVLGAKGGKSIRRGKVNITNTQKFILCSAHLTNTHATTKYDIPVYVFLCIVID